MKKVSLLILLPLFLLGCSTISYLPSNSSATYPPTNRCEVLWNKPQVPWLEIGLITVECSGGPPACSDENMMLKLKAKAISVGADAVICNFGPDRKNWWITPDFSAGVVYTGSITTRRIEGMAIRFKDDPPKLQPSPLQKSITSTSAAPPSSTNNFITVTWTFANVRSGVGNDHPVVTTVKQGDNLTVIGESGDWFNVRLENGQQGWISNRVVK